MMSSNTTFAVRDTDCGTVSYDDIMAKIHRIKQDVSSKSEILSLFMKHIDKDPNEHMLIMPYLMEGVLSEYPGSLPNWAVYNKFVEDIYILKTRAWSHNDI